MTSERVGTPFKALLSHEFERTHDIRTLTRSIRRAAGRNSAINCSAKIFTFGCDRGAHWLRLPTNRGKAAPGGDATPVPVSR
jgi:hypothetical protein